MRIVLLRRSVFRRPHRTDRCARARIVGIPELHQPKIHQNDPSIGTHNHILRFDIAVDDTLAMTILQRIEQLVGPGAHLRFGQLPLSGDTLRQALPFDEIHHQVRIAGFLEEIGHAHQMRMAEIRQHRRFLLKLLTQLRQRLPVDFGLRQHLLDRARGIQPEIPDPVDCAHSALAQLPRHAIPSLKHIPHFKAHRTLLSQE